MKYKGHTKTSITLSNITDYILSLPKTRSFKFGMFKCRGVSRRLKPRKRERNRLQQLTKEVVLVSHTRTMKLNELM